MQRVSISRRHCKTCGESTKHERYVTAMGCGDLFMTCATMGLWIAFREVRKPSWHCSDCGSSSSNKQILYAALAAWIVLLSAAYLANSKKPAKPLDYRPPPAIEAERDAQYEANQKAKAEREATTLAPPPQSKAQARTAETLKRIYPLESPEGTKRVGMIPEGATVKVLDTEGDFVQVNHGEITGWTEQSSIE